MSEAEVADCSAMEGMKGTDMSSMDKDSPVTQAIMKKCMEQWHENDEDGEEGESPDKEVTTPDS